MTSSSLSVHLLLCELRLFPLIHLYGFHLGLGSLLFKMQSSIMHSLCVANWSLLQGSSTLLNQYRTSFPLQHIQAPKPGVKSTWAYPLWVHLWQWRLSSASVCPALPSAGLLCAPVRVRHWVEHAGSLLGAGGPPRRGPLLRPRAFSV